MEAREAKEAMAKEARAAVEASSEGNSPKCGTCWNCGGPTFPKRLPAPAERQRQWGPSMVWHKDGMIIGPVV